MINLNEKVFEEGVIPQRTGDIKKVHIRDLLSDLGSPVESLNLGNFDYIGEFTAKKQRTPDKKEFKEVGAFFRPNYERGLLIHALIKKYDIKKYMEIGFGRGYSCFCAAMTMEELGRGEVITVDPRLDKDMLERMSSIFPGEWFQRISFYQSTSDEFFKDYDMSFDMAYIDGDHTYKAVKKDWVNVSSKDPSVVLFDDYHLPGKVQKDMEVSSLVDEIEDDSKTLIIMDRRIFLDDRGYSDEEIDYGQVLITR